MTHNEATNLPDTGAADLVIRLERDYKDGKMTLDSVCVILTRTQTVVRTYRSSTFSHSYRMLDSEATPGVSGEEGEVEVETRRHWLFWSLRIYKRTYYDSDILGSEPNIGADPDSIYQAAERLLATYKEREVQQAYVESFVGYYPPKRLADR